MRHVALLSLAGLLVGGCVTTRTVERSGLPVPPKPRPAPQTPIAAVPNRMLLMVPPKPEDADGNGFPDTIRVVAALFSEPYPMATRADGAFVFELFRQGEAVNGHSEPIATWRLEGVELDGTSRDAIFGPCYSLVLLLERTSDRMPPTTADLRGRFELLDGTVVKASSEVRQVQLGSAFHAGSRSGVQDMR